MRWLTISCPSRYVDSLGCYHRLRGVCVNAVAPAARTSSRCRRQSRAVDQVCLDCQDARPHQPGRSQCCYYCFSDENMMRRRQYWRLRRDDALPTMAFAYFEVGRQDGHVEQTGGLCAVALRYRCTAYVNGFEVIRTVVVCSWSGEGSVED